MSDTTAIQHLDIHLIQPNPHQPRKHLNPDELAELVESIKIHGVLEPIVVAHTPAGYQIIAGERRWRAAQKAGLTTIPTIIKKTSPRGMLELSIVENVQRSDLNPLERAHALKRLMDEFQLSATDIAARIGKSASYISNSIKLLALPDALKDGLLSGLISEGHARALQAIPSIKNMIEAYKMILKESASVRRAEEIARRFRAEDGDERPQRTPRRIVSEDIDRWQSQMHHVLGENSDIQLRRSFRQTQVVIKLKGSLQETQKQLDLLLSIANRQ